jgi:predicted transglutaminase-like protease
MPKQKAPDIKKWIKAQLKEARKELKLADKARDESDYTDIDALEQYCYNDGVIDTLIELRSLLR